MADPHEPTAPRQIHRFRSGAYVQGGDRLVAEAPVEIRLNGTPLAVMMRTPGQDIDLVTGFALTEGIVLDPAEITSVSKAGADGDDARWEITLAPEVDVDPEQFRRNVYATSSCGVCGKASIDAVRIAAKRPPRGPVVPSSLLLGLPGEMEASQDYFRVTGGLHAAAAFTPSGELLSLCEDIGRHNAVDKLVGTLAGERWPLGELLLIVSGRVSFEIVQKAAVAGIPFVAGVSAASSLAVELAEELGMTVVGFLRPDGFNLYCGADRLALS